LNTLREINNLCGIQRINSWLFVDLAQALRLMDELLPPAPVVRVGGSQSWLRE